MALLEILRYPDPRLRQPCRPLGGPDDPPPDELRRLVEDMAETMYVAKGAGLAAIQVGHPLHLFIIEATVAGGGENDPVLAFLNPEILELGRETETSDEGCLSFPNIYVPVKRAQRARVRALDLDGRPFEVTGQGIYARALQHEHDHLTGRLLIDFVGPVKRQLIKRQLHKESLREGEKAVAQKRQGL